jgi:hypothetical protein
VGQAHSRYRAWTPPLKLIAIAEGKFRCQEAAIADVDWAIEQRSILGRTTEDKNQTASQGAVTKNLLGGFGAATAASPFRRGRKSMEHLEGSPLGFRRGRAWINAGGGGAMEDSLEAAEKRV